MKAWQQRLGDYRQKVADHEYMKSRIDSEIRNQSFDIRQEFDITTSRRFSWELRTVISPVMQCRIDLQEWEQKEFPAMQQYEQSEQYLSDLKMERLVLLEKREYENKYHIEVEKSERSLRQGYGRDYGWETGSVILSMCQGELNELSELRAWRAKTNDVI